MAAESKEKVRCKAKSKGTGAPCKYPVVAGREVCRFHGGNSPKGIAHYNYKHGRYSKALPPGIKEKYEEARNDEKLNELSEEVALIDSQLQERLEKVYSGETSDWWARVRGLFTSLQLAVYLPDSEESKEGRMIHALECLGAAIDNGAAHFHAFESIRSMVETRRKLIETESKRLKDLDQTIKADQALQIIGMLADVVNRVVKDPDEKKLLSQEIYLIANK